QNPELVSKFDSLKNNSLLHGLRKDADNYKHWGNLDFKGLYQREYGVIQFNQTFSSQDLEPKIIDIDEYCDVLLNVNNTLVDFSKYLWDELNFEQYLGKNEKGEYEITF
ncbi:MAG: hypothetical protein Q8862_12265, partial [Bacteroidota bacterium]|nr:hypothetical protein [Bacteroidota bacterium]